jgi:acetyl esterase/lipase
MTGLSIAVAFLLLLWCALLYVPFRWRPVGIYLFSWKVLAVVYVPFMAVLGIALAVVGAVSGSWWTAIPAALVAVGAVVVMVRVGAVHVDLTGALGPGWGDRIPAGRRRGMVRHWWTGPITRAAKSRWRRDVPFATVPGTDRVLLCDVWQPPDGVTPSGMAVVYLHGGGYAVLDKDLPSMAGDALRAVAWVRERAAELEVDPSRIVLAGGSSGGHLALLAAYGHDAPAITPRELAGTDLHVQAVVSYYGQVGLDTMYWHTGQDKTTRSDDPEPDWTRPPSRLLTWLFGDTAARMRLQFLSFGGSAIPLTGGTPDAVAERYAEASALTYVDAECPPTLLMHGTHDEMAPVAAVRTLQERLEQSGVPVTAVYLPHADHMLDAGTKWSPAARVALYALERFLAVLSVTEPRTVTRP